MSRGVVCVVVSVVVMVSASSSSSSSASSSLSCPVVMQTSGQVERRLINAGFHRDLETTVFLSSPEDLDSCVVLLKETFPPGSFVDPHQLAFLRALGGPDFYVPQIINVETPEHQSPRVIAYFFTHVEEMTDGRWLANISVPIHFRYHRAWSGQNQPSLEAHVHIPHPAVLLHCDAGVSDACSPLVHLEPCPPAGPQLCQWLPVHTFSTSEGAVASIPVGNTDLLDTVLLTTTCLTAAATLLILAALAKKTPPSPHTSSSSAPLPPLS
ncbi:Phosphatidylinositol-glycan biosynthesis class X protein [Portunus trituberculatus]|uniref:Phosphatidylinositol-glycan biosynthesis class X protein n=1 Tax=Portunus trituberculatus TaxID=210409 RepID=A0A5B7EZX7_PORTR|nr:Phosphatidylinositol-glycan biosynthesis class X protein [Portunus trituberculatus]